jgi:hypothetical protein
VNICILSSARSVNILPRKFFVPRRLALAARQHPSFRSKEKQPMDIPACPGSRTFRLWIATYRDWRPARWNDVPPRATALEPVDEGFCSADEAALFVEGFNQAMLGQNDTLWAVAVPVTLRYEGDAQVGQAIEGYAFAEAPRAEQVARGPAAPLSAGAAGDHFQGFDQSPQRSR